MIGWRKGKSSVVGGGAEATGQLGEEKGAFLSSGSFKGGGPAGKGRKKKYCGGRGGGEKDMKFHNTHQK